MLAKQGKMPLAYLLEVMRNESEAQPVRLDAAKAAAPYCHPRLSQMDIRAYQEMYGLLTVREAAVIDAQRLEPEQRQLLRQVIQAALEEADEVAETSYRVLGD
jgi:hypothetical protein